MSASCPDEASKVVLWHARNSSKPVKLVKFDPSVPILKFCAFHPNALVLRRREAASKDAPVCAGPGAAFWSILRDARLRLAPQDEGVSSPCQSTFTVSRTNFESGTLGQAAVREAATICLYVVIH